MENVKAIWSRYAQVTKGDVSEKETVKFRNKVIDLFKILQI